MAKIKFGTSGWRAIIADDFTFANVKVVVAAIAQYILTQGVAGGVIVGRDTRFLGNKFAELAVRVLGASGVKSLLCVDPVPTPTISYEIIRSGLAGGINFTASHNPAEYNGIKFTGSDGAPALPEVTKKIERFIERLQEGEEVKELPLEEAKGLGMATLIEPADDYLKGLEEKIDKDALRRANLKLAVDHMNSTSVGYLDAFLKKLGVRLKRFRQDPDPRFGGGRPDPIRPNLGHLISLLEDDPTFTLGLATDGDADRFGVVDRGGVFLSANLVIALLVDYLARTRGFKGGVARTVGTTHLIDALAEKHGMALYETPVGFKYISDLILSGKIDIGGEESAGFTMRGHVPEKDGILACLLTAEMVARQRRSLVQLRDRLFKEVGPYLNEREDIAITPAQGERFRRKTASPPERFGGRVVKGVKEIDGIKFLLEGNAWVLMRESGTEPLIRLYAEAPTQEELNRLLEAGREFILR